ncbi:MAG: tryptophanyl-tRNA synthetase [Candidatus Midichloriaceae bacterium]|jgi:tryptophanyl-tRNA synthetase
MIQKRVFSGIQPTGNITIGNYLGAIESWVDMQNNNLDCLFCIVDLHALTSLCNPQELRQNIQYNIAVYIASGLDPKKVTIFQQSKVPQHAELAWILSCFTQIGWLNRMTQFKDKSGKNKEKANLGLYSYPVLMAADILLYNADLVPIGDDQKQHIELTRDIAVTFNRKVDKEFFTIPNFVIKENVKRIMSLKDASKKMSKSDASDLSRINLSDNEELIRKKIRKSKTDDINGISYDPEIRAEISNLINIYSGFSKLTKDEVVKKFNSASTSEFKDELASVIVKKVCPIHKKAQEILEDQKFLQNIAIENLEKARSIALDNIIKIKKILGLE